MARLCPKHGQISSGAPPQIEGGGEEVRRQREEGRRRGEGKVSWEGIWWQTAVGDSRPVWMTLQSSHMPDRCQGW